MTIVVSHMARMVCSRPQWAQFRIWLLATQVSPVLSPCTSHNRAERQVCACPVDERVKAHILAQIMVAWIYASESFISLEPEVEHSWHAA
jgi:hypothetical protein